MGIFLDIDNTICDTDYYFIQRICALFPYPDSLDAESLWLRYRHVKNIEFYNRGEIMNIMHSWISCNDFQEGIPEVENICTYLSKISRQFSISAYVTSRPEVVRRGTETWLRRHDFPVAPLVMRPDCVSWSSHAEWKGATLARMTTDRDYIIDDSLEVANFFVSFTKASGTFILYGYNGVPFDGTQRIFCCPRWCDVCDAILV